MGDSVKVSYSDNIADSEGLAQRFIGEPVVGFDIESNKGAGLSGVNKTSIKQNISLIQLARDVEVGLFHIARHQGTTVP